MKNTNIILLLIVLIMSCSSKTKDTKEIKNINLKDSIEQQEKDSIYKIEENIAISNIEFGINKSEYTNQSKIFIESLKGNKSVYPKFGNYYFELTPRFSADSLYGLVFRFWNMDDNLPKDNKSFLEIWGEWINPYELLNKQYETLTLILNEKYSEPNYHASSMNLYANDLDILITESEIDDINICNIPPPNNRKYAPPSERISIRYYTYDIWEIGNKNLEIRLYFSYTDDTKSWTFDYGWQRLYLIIYQKNIYERLNNELLELEKKKKEDENRKKELKKKRETENIDKTIKAL